MSYQRTISGGGPGGGTASPAAAGVVTVVAASGAAQTLTTAAGADFFDVTLTANCTFTFAGATAGQAAKVDLLLRQDATGSRTVTWPASVTWVGSAPIIDPRPTFVTRVTFWSVDGGTTWLGGTSTLPPLGFMTQSGTLANRPPANSVPAGVTYLASDDNGGTTYRSNGSSWTKGGAGATQVSPTPYVYVSGGTDTAIQAAINSLTAAGGVVWLAPVNFDINNTITVPSNVTLQGSGRSATQLILKADIIALDLSGTATGVGNHKHKIGLRDFTLLGQGGTTNQTNPLVRAYYLDTSLFERVNFGNHCGIAWQSVEMWDCTFDVCRWDNCGGSTGLTPTPGGAANGLPAILFLNQDNNANTGFGGSTDTTNEIHFFNCTNETFRDGGLWILGDAYTSTRIAGPFEFVGCKWDTVSSATGPYVIVNQTIGCFFTDFSSAILGAGSAWNSTPFSLLVMQSVRDWSFSGGFKFNGSSSVCRSGLKLDGTVSSGNGYGEITRVRGLSSTGAAPSVALVEFTGTNNAIQYGNIAWYQYSGSIPRVSGAPTTVLQGPVVRVKSGTPTDADYGTNPGVPYDGMGPVVDSVTKLQYVRIAGAWVPLTAAGSIAAATDATIASPTSGQVLTWNGSKWVNQSAAAGGSGGLPQNARALSIETFYREQYSSGTFNAVAGREYLVYAKALQSFTASKIAMFGTSAQTGATLIRFGLYTVDGSGNLTLVAQTANVATGTPTNQSNSTAQNAFTVANQEYCYPFDASVASTYAVTAGTQYAIGVIVVGATPALACISGNSAFSGSGLYGNPSRLAAFDSGDGLVADLQATVTAGKLSNSAILFYAACLA